MTYTTNSRSTPIHLVDRWLPLALELREDQGWSDDTAALVALIMRAALLLKGTSSPPAARAILMAYHVLCRIDP
jgi:hypothetical protein